MNPDHINELQWHQAMGYARQASARIFRDGGSPADALKAFSIELKSEEGAEHDWSKTVEAIAAMLCRQPQQRKKAA